jgi:hypothetical protein
LRALARRWTHQRGGTVRRTRRRLAGQPPTRARECTRGRGRARHSSCAQGWPGCRCPRVLLWCLHPWAALQCCAHACITQLN